MTLWQKKKMSRLKKIFETKGKNILNIYCTAGYPRLHSTLEVMNALRKNGADIIELGMPYSDPLADGPVIQHSSTAALANGMTLQILFEQLREIRTPSGVGEIPVVLMGYLNPVLQYGFEKFCADAAAAGVDGLIIPDLPVFEFETEFRAIVQKYGLDFIFLVTPETPAERVKKLDSLSNGFLYAVSSSSTTGHLQSLEAVTAYLQSLKSLKLKNPVLVGFGIGNKVSFDTLCRFADGAVIGSAFIKSLENAPDIHASAQTFLSSILS